MIQFFLIKKRPHATFKYAWMINVMTFGKFGKTVCFNNITIALPCNVTIENMNELN